MDKKKIKVAIAGIGKALMAGYTLLRAEENLPEVQEQDLPVLAGRIIVALKGKLAYLEENERFEGLTPEEIESLKKEEKAAAIAANLEASADDFAAMLALKQRKPDPVDDVTEGQSDDDQGGDLNKDDIDSDLGSDPTSQ